MADDADVRSELIKAAQSAPHLLDMAKEADPNLFKLLTGPSSASIWASPVTGVIVGLAARYGRGWDKDTCASIAAIIIFLGTALFHYLLPQPAAKQ